jgi:hypothetical protein
MNEQDKRFEAAKAAMQGILSASPKDMLGNIDIAEPKYVAELSVEFADELLNQLNTQNDAQ